jgi:hypothetical protein
MKGNKMTFNIKKISLTAAMLGAFASQGNALELTGDLAYLGQREAKYEMCIAHAQTLRELVGAYARTDNEHKGNVLLDLIVDQKKVLKKCEHDAKKRGGKPNVKVSVGGSHKFGEDK